jgi:mannose-6-phosphate isomerase-like protein (cupin superfamily)
MSLQTHDNYQRVAAAAQHSHEHNRSVAAITAQDVDLARLYSYAFRAHVIGAFHATRVALDACPPRQAEAEFWRRQAITGLRSLADQAVDPIGRDFRAVISTFHRYDTMTRQVLVALDAELSQTDDVRVAEIRNRFRDAMQRITLSNGLLPVRGGQTPEQASFLVPGLGITIVPLVYGDSHCWNEAYLSGSAGDVPRHLHEDGVEIHLGFGALRGFTVLDRFRAEVKAGYAMAIPPRTPHGFQNTSGHEHYLPFIFGSKRLGGWGIALDVESQPIAWDELELVPFDAPQMNGLVPLDQEIERTAALPNAARRTLVPPEATYRPHAGALVLSVTRVAGAGFDYPLSSFRILNVVRGCGTVRIGAVEQELGPHDHLGIPAGMAATICPRGNAPLVVLDALLVETNIPDHATS